MWQLVHWSIRLVCNITKRSPKQATPSPSLSWRKSQKNDLVVPQDLNDNVILYPDQEMFV